MIFQIISFLGILNFPIYARVWLTREVMFLPRSVLLCYAVISMVNSPFNFHIDFRRHRVSSVIPVIFKASTSVHSLLGFHAEICLLALSRIIPDIIEASARVKFLLGSNATVCFIAVVLSLLTQSSTSLTLLISM